MRLERSHRRTRRGYICNSVQIPDPVRALCLRAYSVLLEPDEVGKRYKSDANRDQENIVANKIRKDHQGESAYEGDDCSLLLAIDEEAKSY